MVRSWAARWALPTMRVGALVEAPDEEGDDGLEDEGEDQGEDDLGDAVLDEVGEVGLPGSFRCARGNARRGQRWW